jgi:hypothetical protein
MTGKKEILRLLKGCSCENCRFSFGQEKTTVKIPYEHDRSIGGRKNVTSWIWYCNNKFQHRDLDKVVCIEPTEYCERYDRKERNTPSS